MPRYAWWTEESADGSKSSLLLKAAQYYDPKTGNCPVCERTIEDAKLRKALESLKKLDAAAGIGAQVVLQRIVGLTRNDRAEKSVGISTKTIKQLIDHDWTSICGSHLHGELAPLSAKFSPKVFSTAANTQGITINDIELLPDDCDGAFRLAASKFVAAMRSAHLAIEFVWWSSQNLAPISPNCTNT